MRVKDLESFKEKGNLIHKGFYTYDKSVYQGTKIPLTITCPIHGDFEQTPNDHLNGKGCKECGKIKAKEANIKYNTKTFIEECKKIYGNDIYDFSITQYKGSHEDVECICNKHGHFKQKAYLMLQGHGCQECGKERIGLGRRKELEDFIKKSREIFGEDTFDYSKVIYKGNKIPITLICKKCGNEITLTPNDHLSRRRGCKECTKKIKNIEKGKEFVKNSKLIHGDKYIYTDVVYKGTHETVDIICPIHGKFPQTPSKHLQGHGCPMCKSSKLENQMRQYLTENKIKFEEQKHFEWLGKQSLDFYLPQYKVGIECQGIQHFESIDFFGGKEHLEYVKELDRKKKKLCQENNINIQYYNYFDKEININITKTKNKF